MVAAHRVGHEIDAQRLDLGQRAVRGVGAGVATSLQARISSSSTRVSRSPPGAARPRRAACSAPVGSQRLLWNHCAARRWSAARSAGAAQLELGERGVAVAEQRQRRGQLQPRVGSRVERDRLAQVGGRLEDAVTRVASAAAWTSRPAARSSRPARLEVVGGLRGVGQRLPEPLVVGAAAGVVEVRVDRLAQQRVAEAEAPVGAEEEAAVGRPQDGLRIGKGGQLGAVEVAARDGGELRRASGRLVKRGDRGADGTAQRGRRARVAARRGAGALERQQRVAVGGGDHALALEGAERSRRGARRQRARAARARSRRWRRRWPSPRGRARRRRRGGGPCGG